MNLLFFSNISSANSHLFIYCFYGVSGLTLVSLHLAKVYMLHYHGGGLQTTRRGHHWLQDICSNNSIRSYMVQGDRIMEAWQTDTSYLDLVFVSNHVNSADDLSVSTTIYEG